MFRVFHQQPQLRDLAKDAFAADMHYHTSHSHDCQTPVKDIARVARRLGITVAITDHNRVGGVEEAREHKDVSVIPGIEVCTKEGKEVIAYFYDAGQLKDFHDVRLAPYIRQKNPMRSTRTHVPMAELLSLLASEQCVVHLPHPFAPQPRRSFAFFNRKPQFLTHVHSIEVLNQQVTRKANLAALGWAVQLGKGIAGGSDGHALRRLGQCVTVSTATNIEEHLNHVKRGQVTVYGTELRPSERLYNFAGTTVKNKIENGLKGTLRKLTFQEEDSGE